MPVNYFVQSKGILVELRAKFTEETLDTWVMAFLVLLKSHSSRKNSLFLQNELLKVVGFFFKSVSDKSENWR